MTRDIAAHVRLVEHGLPDQPERAHAYVEMLGHNVYPVRLEPGTGVVWKDVHGVGMTKAGDLVFLVGTRWERVELGEEE